MKQAFTLIKNKNHSRMLLSGSSTLEKTKAEQTPDYNLRGWNVCSTRGWNSVKAFTLIELLVVVLIIGILAAVALPQYQKAVAKSRYATLKAAGNALATAQRAYFLENGQYACDLADLAIEMPAEANCYVVQGSPCTNWGCSFKSKGARHIAYYFEDMERYCVVWDGADAILQDVCKQDTGKTTGRHSDGGGYTEYKY